MLNKFGFHLVTMWQSLWKAIKEDKEWPVTNEQTGKREYRLNIWFKTFWITLVILLLAGIIIWDLIRPVKMNKKRSHHGYNKYGERY